jgi:hypothetical protein
MRRRSTRLVARVYAESGPRRYRCALMILADHGDAEDVIQRVFATLLDKAPRIDHEPAFVRTAVRNAAYSLLRQRRTARLAQDRILEPLAPLCSATEQAALEQALRSLRGIRHELPAFDAANGRRIPSPGGRSSIGRRRKATRSTVWGVIRPTMGASSLGSGPELTPSR